MRKLNKKMYYLDAESTGLELEQRLTAFSADQNDLVEDYLKWVREHDIDFDHTSFSDIREMKTDLLVCWLEQVDTLDAVIIHPVTITVRDRVRGALKRLREAVQG